MYFRAMKRGGEKKRCIIEERRKWNEEQLSNPSLYIYFVIVENKLLMTDTETTLPLLK